jgi:hypothetical protein
MGKGAQPSAPSQQTVTQTNLPEYARPYFENILQRSQAESYRPYEAYQGERIAGFAPTQTAAQQEVARLTTPSQFGAATNLATAAGLGALQAGQYQPGQFNVQQITSPALTQYQMGPAREVSAQQVVTPEMAAAQTGFRPDLQTFQMGPAQQVAAGQVSAQDIQAAQTGFNPQLERFQMTAPEHFGQAQAQQYMTPYMQQVVDVQKRQALEDAQKAQLSQNLAAARQGTYGGARQALLQSERERALGTQLGDIQARGLQSAYESAQQQFERDRAAGMTAQQRNLEAALGVQQLGTQTGLQTALANLSNEQQARVTSEANRLQAQGMTQDAALRAALANQQAGLTTGQQNLAAQLGIQELGTRTGLEASLANLSAAQQANVQNLAAQLQTQGLNAEQAMRAALANQQAGLTVGQQNLAALLGTQELGSQQAMQAALANQQYGLEAQKLAEQSRQFGADVGLRGLGQAGQAAGLLGDLGTSQQANILQRLQAQSAAGAEQRGLSQQALDMAYADFLRQRDYPMEQLGYFSNILRGLPIGLGSTQTTYAQPPSFASQLGGLGLAGLGLYNLGR